MKKILSLFCLFFLFAPVVHAESLSLSKTSTQIKAEITEIKSSIPVTPGMTAFDFRAKADTGEIYNVNTNDSAPNGIAIKLKVGEKIFLQKIDGNPPQIYFDDVERTGALWWIALLFVALSLAVGLKRGFWSLVGLGITLLVLFGYVFPSILHGQDVITVTIIGSIGILAVNMHIAHGFRKESFLAFLSTVIGFFCVWLFAHLFTSWANITGTGSEDAVLLVGDAPVHILSIRLFLAGVILGAVGVLDDIAISQTEIVHELVMTDATLTRKQLFFSSMRIGRHHIASTINTLVLVYAGASMPILILFLYHSGNVSAFLNSEIVTEEIVRTIAGTAALILTVPISTFIATYGYNPKSLDTPHKHA
ncbi:MAG: YibE/F family protein [Candidatus Uhrbacteria bacterium]|nr:YibE/F family protein [Candidatus Uhrbacteria bacterium]